MFSTGCCVSNGLDIYKPGGCQFAERSRRSIHHHPIFVDDFTWQMLPFYSFLHSFSECYSTFHRLPNVRLSS